MSNFLDFTSPSLDVGTTPASAIASIKARLVTVIGWQLVAENTGADPYIIVKPPAGQSLGNSRGHGVLCIRAGSTNNKIEFHTGLYCSANDKDPQKVIIRAGSNMRTGSGGSPEISVKINGSTISGTLAATVDGSLASLYSALVASADSNAQLFNYSYQTNNGTYPTQDDTILCTAKAPTTDATFSMPTPSKVGTSDGFTFQAAADACLSGTMPHRSWSLAGSVAVDYTYGFIYFLSIMQRTIMFATKTSSALNGPIFGSWADNAVALANTPAACTPIELVGGDLSGAKAYGGAVCTTSHVWMKSSGYRSYYGPTPASCFNRTAEAGSYVQLIADVWSGSSRNVSTFMDANAVYVASGGSPRTIYTSCGQSVIGVGGLTPSSAGYAVAALGSPSIASVGLVPYQGNTGLGSGWPQLNANEIDELGGYPGYVYPFVFVPGLPLPDVTVFLATASDESLHVVKHQSIATTLVTVLDNSSSYTSIQITDASSFPTAGNMIIDGEIFGWTGKSSNTLTGCTRGLNGSTKVAHSAGAAVSLALWMLKINGGAMPCGYVPPV